MAAAEGKWARPLGALQSEAQGGLGWGPRAKAQPEKGLDLQPASWGSS